MRTLYLLRHGVAERKPSGGNDHDRPLAPAGRWASERMGAHLARTLLPPSLFLCSSARRAVETLEVVRSYLPAPAEMLCERGLYLTGASGGIGPTWNGRIISLSSCSTMWQCQT